MIGWRDLTSLGRMVAGLIVGGAILVAIALISRAWDGVTAWLPWSDESRLAHVEAQLDQAETDLARREAEVAALERQAEQTAAAHQTIHQARAVTARATTLAETAPDADDPIDPVRADRLRNADRRLCELAPDLCSDPDDPPAGDGA